MVSISINVGNERNREHTKRPPLDHHLEAQEKFSSDSGFPLPISEQRAGFLVFPTGAGKTYCTISWILEHVIPLNHKVIWIAYNSILLEQAYNTFIEYAWMVKPPKNKINIRVVSGEKKHSTANSIENKDDILIISKQTLERSIPNNGESSPFTNYINNNSESGFFIVIDEAHHAVSPKTQDIISFLQKNIKNNYLLGLTATPTRGKKEEIAKLFQIFYNGIIAEADRIELEKRKILAIPIFDEQSTSFHLDFIQDYKHQIDLGYENDLDLPSVVIDIIARNSERNQEIVEYYDKNKQKLKKTIIFTDRKYQCNQIVEMLEKKGIKVGGMHNDKSKEHNAGVLEQFKRNEIEVLVNINMLIEGVDIPDVNTVIIPRRTTSKIFLSQMVGRALRGPVVTGNLEKEYANIVVFKDKIKDNIRDLLKIKWATPEDIGFILNKLEVIDNLFDKLIKLPSNNQKNCDIPSGYYNIWYEGKMNTKVIKPIFNSVSNNGIYSDFIQYIIKEYSKNQKFQFFSHICSGENYLQSKFIDILNECFSNYSIDMTLFSIEDFIDISKHVCQNNKAPEYTVFLDSDYQYFINKINYVLFEKSVTIEKKLRAIQLLDKIPSQKTKLKNLILLKYSNLPSVIHKEIIMPELTEI